MVSDQMWQQGSYCDTALLSFWLHFEPHSLCHTGPVFGGKAIDMSTVLSRQTPKTPAPLSYVHMNHLRKSVHTVKKKKSGKNSDEQVFLSVLLNCSASFSLHIKLNGNFSSLATCLSAIKAT